MISLLPAGVLYKYIFNFFFKTRKQGVLLGVENVPQCPSGALQFRDRVYSESVKMFETLKRELS